MGSSFALASVPGMTGSSVAENSASNARSGYSSSSASPSPSPSTSSPSSAVVDSPAGGRGSKPPKHSRKFEALEDPLVTIMNRYILLEEKKLQMELDREARLEGRRSMMD